MTTKTMDERRKRVLRQAAVQAEHWPEGHIEWGKTIDGLWTNNRAAVGEYG